VYTKIFLKTVEQLEWKNKIFNLIKNKNKNAELSKNNSKEIK